MASPRNNRPRRIAITLALAVAGCSAALAYGIAVPELVAWKLRRELADRGLANARFRIVSVGLDRLALADVELRPGLHLGEVELDAGISLLWRDAERITVRRARITRDTLAGEGSSALGALPFRWLRLEDSVLVVEGVDVAIAGTFAVGEPPASAEATARLPVLTIGTVTLRDVVIRLHAGRACATARAETAEVDACAMLRSWAPDELAVTWATSDHGAGWRASGDARLAWSAGLTIRDGRVEATVARGSFEGLAFSDAAVTASFGGTAE
ncbi:MAG: hypothetical protein ABI867_29625, partial [Kofleriaceae bacterium]